MRLAVGSLRRDGSPLEHWLRRPESSPAGLSGALAAAGFELPELDAIEQVHVELRYGGYLERQDRQIERLRTLEASVIPSGLDYARISALRLEAREQLSRMGPRTVGQAARIPGINPADIMVLLMHLKADRPRRQAP